MGLLVLSLVLAVMGGCVSWLVLGDRLPLHAERKWATWRNIALYALALAVPFYLIIFALF